MREAAVPRSSTRGSSARVRASGSKQAALIANSAQPPAALVYWLPLAAALLAEAEVELGRLGGGAAASPAVLALRGSGWRDGETQDEPAHRAGHAVLR